MRKLGVLVAAILALLSVSTPPSIGADPVIQHVIIVVQENHSFDDTLGKLCVMQARGALTRAGLNMPCDGTTEGVLADGSPYSLTLERDHGLFIDHALYGHRVALNGGRMDGFSNIGGCKATSSPPYGCLAQFDPTMGTCGVDGTRTCIPNVAALARNYAISDRTFEFRPHPSWAAHMVLGSATVQSFKGGNPHHYAGDPPVGPGWGCDSAKRALWRQGTQWVLIPSCIPDPSGSMGPLWSSYTGPAPIDVPTIFDRMDAAGVTWKIYGGSYAWSICPTFWRCIGSAQRNNLVGNTRIFTDLSNGTLPQVSFWIPKAGQSSHPPQAMSAGDNWVGDIVSAVMDSSYWGSSATFITWDDCGCFYDHVNPLQYSKDWGVRVPMLIVSPYAKAGYTDSNPTTFVSMLTFIENLFGLTPLNPCATVEAGRAGCTDDVQGPNGTAAYDYMGAFDFTQAPAPPTPMVHTRVPAAEQRWLAAHPNAGDGLD